VPQGVETVSTVRPSHCSGGGLIQGSDPSKPLPDFDSLLTDLTQTLDASLYHEYDLESLKGGNLMALQPASVTHQDEVTFYDDLPATVPVKSEKLDYGYQDVSTAQLQLQVPSYPSEAPVDETQLRQLTQVDPDMAEVANEVQCVCEHLGIPIDPYSWSADQVHKWASWTLNKYQLPLQFLDMFRMDGTSLCMLSEQDFKDRSPHVGEYLHAELEFLKSAYSVSSNSPSPSHSSHEDSQGATYMDLDSCNQQSQQPAYITMSTDAAVPLNIPKPVFSAPLSLSPAPSLDSMDSASGYGSSPSSLSLENDYDVSLGRSDVKTGVSPSKQNIHLWQFLRELLLQPQSYNNCIRWLDRAKGIFKIEDSARVARLWGQRKNRPAMNYDKLSRSIRQYYKKGIIRKTDNSKRLVYQFCSQYRA
jgi:SAM pointed domain-containing ETS transcription factor